MRYFLLLWIPFTVLLAFALQAFTRVRLLAVLFVLMWGTSGYAFLRSSEILEFAGIVTKARSYPPMQEYVYHLSDKTSIRDFLVGFSESLGIKDASRTYAVSVSDYYLRSQLGIDGTFLHRHLKRYRLESDVRDILKAHPHILLAHDPSDVPLNYAQTVDIIRDKYVVCDALVDEPDLLIRKYTHPLMDCDHEPTPIDYENGMQIVDYVARYEASVERVQTLTWWDVPDARMIDDYNISLQLITKDWRNVRQLDRHLYDNLLPWSVIEFSTVELPAGEYRLMLVLYHRDTGETIAGFDSFGSESSDIIPLLTIEIQS